MKQLIFTIMLWFLAFYCFAQYPVTTIPQLTPPYSTHLQDYTLAGSDKFNLNIWLNDNNELEYDVRLIISIEGEGISLQTAPNFMGPIINLLPGSNTLSGADLEPYFDLNNMVIAGIDEQVFRQEGNLPTGMYSFCVQAIDYRRTDVALSLRACATAMLKQNNPPIPTNPVCGETVLPSDGNNLLFQWQSQADNSVQSEYQFILVEVPEGINADDALNGSGRTMIAPGEVVTDQTKFVYDINQLPLEMGKTYAYRITASDVDGLTTFENNGLSQSCLFQYGPRMNGEIALTRPENGTQLLNRDEVSEVLFSWTKADNIEPSQTFNYEVKLVPILEGQSLEDAMSYNLPKWDTLIEGNSTLNTIGVRTNLDLAFSTAYAWQVIAKVEDIEIASSPVWMFRKGAIISEFLAAGQQIFVETTTSTDLNNFSGTGRMRLDGSDLDSLYKVSFQNITIRKGGENVMVAGEIQSPLKDFIIELDFGDNGAATFNADSVVVSPDDLMLSGKTLWEYPHAVRNGNGTPILKSVQTRLLYNDFSLLGTSKFEESTVELLDPIDFSITYRGDSEFFVRDKALTANMNLDVLLPQEVKDINDTRITIPFRDVDDAFIAFANDLSDLEGIHFLDQTSMVLKLDKITLDLSEENSFGNLSDDQLWKGIYFDEFTLAFPTDFDNSNQLVLDERLDLNIKLQDKRDYRAWVESTGLQLFVNEIFEGRSGPTASFNTFSDNFQDIKFEVENNSLRDGHIKGIVFIPLLDPDEEFKYTVPIDEDGLKPGFLDEDLSSRVVEFNKDKEEMHLTMTVKQAVFAENERLDMVVDLEWEGIQILMPDCQGLSVWGDGGFGFEKRNGAKAVSHVSGEYKNTYEITIDSLSAGMSAGTYAFGFIGSIIVGDEGSGISGETPSNPPKFNMVTAVERQVEESSEGQGDNWFSNYLQQGIYDPLKESQLTIVIPIKVKTGVVDVKGKLIAMHNNPDWGNAFYGKMAAKIKKPKKFEVDATVLIGKKGETNYWFVEMGLKAGAGTANNDTPSEGLGAAASAQRLAKFGAKPQSKLVKITNNKGLGGSGRKGVKLGKVELIEFRGRIYYHMNHDISQGMFKDCPVPPESEPSNPTRVDLSLPEFDLIPDIDLPNILANLSIPNLKDLLCRMERSALLAVMSRLPEPNTSHLSQEVPDVDWPGVKARFPGFTYTQAMVMFPGQDWCSIIATIPNIDWGEILLDLPSFPNFPDLCEVNQFVWNKILQQVNTQVEPDSAFLVSNGHLTSDEWVDVEFTGPKIVWTDLSKQYPHKNWCGVIVKLPGIDWGSIMLNIDLPQLTLPDIRALLARLNINWQDFLPSIPDLSFDMNVVLPPLQEVDVDMSLLGKVDIKYDIDPSTSYGGMLMVGLQDAPTSGKFVIGFAALELSLDADHSLKQIGLQVGANFMNVSETESMVKAIGCMSYTVATETFTADLKAEAKKGGICGEGYLHLRVSPNEFMLGIGSENQPIRVQKCPVGIGALGWFKVEDKPGSTIVGVGLGTSFRADLETPEFGIDGVCTVKGTFKSFIEVAVFGEAEVANNFRLIEAGMRFAAGVDIGVSIKGAICPFGDINLLHLGLSGDLRYNFDTSRLKGTVSGEAVLFEIFSADFDFEMDEEVPL